MFGLLDCNNFFVSCERLFRPELRGKPVVVLSNNDGCVIARSNEVKALGISMGAPLFKVKDIIEKNQVTIFSSNFSLYGDLSSRVMDLIESLVPRIEVYSIDEAFIDLSGISQLQQTAADIRARVMESVGIPTCIGIAKTKTLAKVANHLAKKNPSYDGICVLSEGDKQDAVLSTFDIADLWGVGRRLTERFYTLGIRTALDLKQTDPRWVRQHFTVTGERIVNELNGIPSLALQDNPKPRQTIQVSRSFSDKIMTCADLEKIIASYATRLAEKLRINQLHTTQILVAIRTNYFQSHQRQYHNSFLVTLPCAANDDSTLIKACIQALKVIFKEGYVYHKASVMALDLLPVNQGQYDLFAPKQLANPKIAKISEVLDVLNQRYGRGTVHMATCTKKLSWKDKKIKKSPAYTTSWHELPVVFAK